MRTTRCLISPISHTIEHIKHISCAFLCAGPSRSSSAGSRASAGAGSGALSAASAGSSEDEEQLLLEDDDEDEEGDVFGAAQIRRIRERQALIGEGCIRGWGCRAWEGLEGEQAVGCKCMLCTCADVAGQSADS